MMLPAADLRLQRLVEKRNQCGDPEADLQTSFYSDDLKGI